MAKSSKSAKSERQKLIDDAMKKQRSAEKRSGYLIVGVCVLIALGLVGAAAYRPIKNHFDLQQYANLDLAKVGASASSCQKPVTEDATGAQEHRPTGEQITYPDAPPAFGPHWNEANVAPAPFDDKFYDKDDRPELEALVHNLEHGYTILWYDDTVADDNDQMNQIEAIAKKFKVDDDNFRLKFIAAPWTSADAKEEAGQKGMTFPEGTHLAFSHWVGAQGDQKSVGVWQYCTETSGAALKSFMDTYPYTDAPEPGVI